MSKEVVIKSNRYGINLILDGQIPFQELLGKISDKFKETGDFFRDAKMAISFEGRELSVQEEQTIVDTIMANSSVRIVSIVDTNQELEEQMRMLVEAYLKSDRDALVQSADSGEITATGEANTSAAVSVMAQAAAAGQDNEYQQQDINECSQEMEEEEVIADFYKGNLRSGQIIESASSITVVGDVNPGAKVVSMGNIVILGSLKGNAQAGAGGNRNSFIFALEMRPIQLQIGDLIAKSPDREKGKKRARKKDKDNPNSYAPQIAVARDGNICIEPMKKGSLNHL